MPDLCAALLHREVLLPSLQRPQAGDMSHSQKKVNESLFTSMGSEVKRAGHYDFCLISFRKVWEPDNSMTGTGLKRKVQSARHVE